MTFLPLQQFRGDRQPDNVLPPGTVLGAYVLAESIGCGGMGRVYKAVHQRMRRTVAIKVLSPRWLDCQEARSRFRREVESAARLSHKNVVTAFDAGEADGHHYLAMEYVPGRNLTEVVRQEGPLPLPIALGYILQAARGLQHAHEMGIVHRDIKPGNLLLDDSGTVKVLDMGIARTAWTEETAGHDELTSARAFLGTAAFMAPEQAANPGRVDQRADIYGLACTLFYLLTGRNAYGGETAMEVVLAHREQPIPSLRQHCPDCLPAVDSLFQRMMAKRPEDRVASMSEVIDELERQLASQLNGRTAEEKPVRNATLSTPRLLTSQSRGPARTAFAATGLALGGLIVIGIVLGSLGKLPWQRTDLGGTVAANGGGDPKSLNVTPIAEKTATTTTATPTTKQAANADEARFVNFLDGIDVGRQAQSGEWEWDGQALVSPATEKFADLALPGKPPEEYLLTVTAQRKQGRDALRLGLVSGDRAFSVVFDLGATVTSFGVLEGLGPGEHAATVRNTVFLKDKPITVKCNVRTRDKRTQLDVYVEGERLVAWAGETDSLGPPRDAPRDGGLYIGSLASSFRITRLELTPLIDGQPAPRWKTPPRTPRVELVKVPGATFTMGSDDREASADQQPAHEVRITRAFQMGKFEVTRDEFSEVMDLVREKDGGKEGTQSNEQGRLPIVGVSWLTAVEFCNQLSLRHGLKPYYSINDEKVSIRGGDGFRLPTEAEWECACRAGTTTKWHFGNDAKLLDEFEWHAGNARGKPHPVGKLKPNPLGLHDMHGNVPEWCWDRYDATYYGRSEVDDPPGSSRGEQRVVRGGSASQRAGQTASASRTSLGTAYGVVEPKSGTLPAAATVAPGSRGVGIRVVRSIE